MTELTYTVPVVGESDTSAEPKVGTALTEIKTVVNGKVGGVNVEAALTGKRLLGEFGGVLLEGKGAATYYATGSTGAMQSGTATEVSLGSPILPFLFLEAGEWEIAGKVTKLTYRVEVASNNTAAGGAGFFTFGLYKVTALSGASGIELK